MRATVFCVFLLVYAAMVLGRLPGLALDRAGVALLGAIVLVAGGTMTVADAWGAADVPTLALLFGLMIISAQLRLGGFYTAVSRSLIAVTTSPAGLLARIMAASAVLSALLANDIVCLAMTPILVEATLARGLNPLPYLIGLALSANIGSAATLIGNPQNMLIGQVSHLSFSGYVAATWPWPRAPRDILVFQSDQIFITFATTGQDDFVAVNQNFRRTRSGVIVRRHGEAVGASRKNGKQFPRRNSRQFAVPGQEIAGLADGTDHIDRKGRTSCRPDFADGVVGIVQGRADQIVHVLPLQDWAGATAARLQPFVRECCWGGWRAVRLASYSAPVSSR